MKPLIQELNGKLAHRVVSLTGSVGNDSKKARLISSLL
jgi:hypothetical protein